MLMSVVVLKKNIAEDKENSGRIEPIEIPSVI